METIGIDIGGSGIKGAVVDAATGSLLTERLRVPTPQPSTPEAVATVVAEIVAGFDRAARPVGCTFPAIVRAGVVRSAANVDGSWIGTNGEDLLTASVGRPVVLLNDADAAGLAEMRFGAGAGRSRGVVILLTFGTGIGSAVFVDGHLHPNTELGHLQLWGDSAEKRAAARWREEKVQTWEEWTANVQAYLDHVERLFSPDLIIFGGGISKKADRFLHLIHTNADLVPAVLRNDAGIVGAAVAASTRREVP